MDPAACRQTPTKAKKQLYRCTAFSDTYGAHACSVPRLRSKSLGYNNSRWFHASQALVALMRSGKLRYVVSQNVDGLHLRSGIPRSKIAELHGNCFAERCPRCKREYIRDFEIETVNLIWMSSTCISACITTDYLVANQVGFRPTGRTCSVEGCKGKLKDHILDWEDALPEDELIASEKAASAADLAICLGTSLQIIPACNLPLRTTKAGTATLQ